MRFFHGVPDLYAHSSRALKLIELWRLSMSHQIFDSDAVRALENGAFVPFFQPQYNFETGAMIGAEVLVRWIMDDGEIVPPGVFIPEFEKNGFIYTGVGV